MRRRPQGFTLFEVMVAVAILGILSASLWGTVIDTTKMRRRSELRQDRYSQVRMTLDRMVRGNESLQRIADVSAVTAPRSHDAADDLAAPEAWADQHAALATLLHQGPQAQQTVGTQTRS